MDDWQKDFWEILEIITTGIEQIFEDVNETVEVINQELDDIFEVITQEIQVSIGSEFDQFIQEFLQPIIELYLEPEDGVETENLAQNTLENQYFEDISDFFVEDGNKPNSIMSDNPACVGCAHYHGQFYGNNLLVCAMHPYGWDDQFCPDWQGYNHDSAHFQQNYDDS